MCHFCLSVNNNSRNCIIINITYLANKKRLPKDFRLIISRKMPVYQNK